jgi:hypothetical protein
MQPEAAAPAPERSGSQRPWLPGLVLAFLFFVIGLACLDDYGATWDEHETYLTSLKAAGGSASEASPPEEGWHVLPGYFFAFDLARGLFSRLVVERLRWLDWIECQHLFHLALASLSICLLYRASFLLSGSVRLSLWIALALALFPKFVGHAQSNPKDLPALSAFVLVAYAMARLHARKSWGNALFSGAALGFAFSVRELSATLPIVYGIWFSWTEGRRLLEHRRKGLAVALAAGAVFLLCWPWLWPNPIGRLLGAVRHFGTLVFDRKVLYLGEIWRTNGLPWHYTLVSLLVATPTVFLVAAALSPLSLDPGRKAVFQRIRRLAWLWIVALFALDAMATTHYDGFRHLLVVLPGVCMLIGLGLENMVHLGERWLRSPIARHVVPGAAVGLAALSCWRTHPYQDAYLNEIVNLFVAGRAEQVFEVEYWGAPYKEGAEWLNAHAEPEAELYLPEMSQAGFYLEREGKALDLERFADLSVPRYFMTITRRAFYRPPVTRVVQTYEPVYEIKRQEATLLRIYRNDRKRSPRRSSAALAPFTRPRRPGRARR